MPNRQLEYLVCTRIATERGPALEAIADRLCGELPKNCARCPWALAVRAAISEDDWWLPNTPAGSRFLAERGDGSGYMVSNTAEMALRSIVKTANEQSGSGPRGEDGSVCCLDTRPIEVADYSSKEL